METNNKISLKWATKVHHIKYFKRTVFAFKFSEKLFRKLKVAIRKWLTFFFGKFEEENFLFRIGFRVVVIQNVSLLKIDELRRNSSV